VGCFLSGIGILAVLAGAFVFARALTVNNEIEGILSVGFGFVIIGLGGVVTAINNVTSILKRQLTNGRDARAEGIKAVDGALDDGR
jgi:hypothetical protein